MGTSPRSRIAPRTPIGRLTAPKLIGRGQELAALVDVVSRPPAVAIVEGEAGIGKSRLVAELADSLHREARVWVGHCQPQRFPFPLQPVVEALSQVDVAPLRLPPVTGVLRGLLPELADFLPAMPEPLGDPGAAAHHVFRALRELLIALGPTVLVLEDLHWADDATVELLHFLLQATPPELSLVLTYRLEDLSEASGVRGLPGRVRGRTGHVRIALAPLDDDGVAELAASAFEVNDVNDDLLHHLCRRTEGVPFAVEEVLRLLHDRGDLVVQDQRLRTRRLDVDEVPSTIRQSVLERLGRLSFSARRLVAAAAVVAQPVGEELLAEVTGMVDIASDAAVEALSEVLRSDLLHEKAAGEMCFRHELVRQSVYDAIPGPRRRQLHVRVARLLEKDRRCPAARIAYHLREAGRLGEWVVYAERAADEASAVFDVASACRILQDVLATASLSPDDRVRLATKLGLAAHAGLAQQEAAAILRSILDHERLPTAEKGHLRFLLGLVLVEAGDMPAACTELARSIPTLESNCMLGAVAMAILAFPSVVEGSMDEHLRWLERATETVERIPHPAIRRNVARIVERHHATVLISIGDPDGWPSWDSLRSASSVQDRRQEARALNSTARCAVVLGHGARAEELVTRAVKLVAELDYLQISPAIGATEAVIDWYGGHWVGLQDRVSALVEDVHTLPALLAGELLRAAQGEPVDEEALEAMMGSVLRSGWLPGFCAATGHLARHLLNTGDPARAFDTADRALAMVRGKGIWVWATEVAVPAVEALIDLGRIEHARALTAEVAGGLLGRDAPAARASLVVCKGLLEVADHHLDRPAESFEEAARAWTVVGWPYEAALAHERAARVLMEVDPPRAQGHVISALQRFTDLGAVPDISRVRALVREHGLTLPYPWRGGRRGIGEELSPREEEILELTAEGRTAAEIARLLTLSRRTVENHLARARRKQRAGKPTAGEPDEQST